MGGNGRYHRIGRLGLQDQKPNKRAIDESTSRYWMAQEIVEKSRDGDKSPREENRSFRRLIGGAGEGSSRCSGDPT